MAEGQRLNLIQVERSLDEIVTFLEPYLCLANAHATDFIVNNFWNTLLPPNMQSELLNMTETELKHLASHGTGNNGEKHADEMDTISSTCIGNARENKVGSTENPEGSISHKHTQQPIVKEVHSNNEEVKHRNSCEELGKEMGVNTNCTDCLPNNATQFTKNGIDSRSHRQNLQTIAKEANLDIENAKYVKDNGEDSQCDKILLLDWQHSCIEDFCRAARKCCIDHQGLTQSYDEVMLHQERTEVFVDTFMNEKKSHEIKRMANLCNNIVQQHNSDLVIDLGSGKGYLGSYLNLQYDIPVLGIDSVSGNTRSDVKRSNILTKQWDGLTLRKQSEANQLKLTKKEKKLLKSGKEVNDKAEKQNRQILKSNRYVPVTMFIENSTDLDKLICSTFPEIYHKYGYLNESELSEDTHSFMNSKSNDVTKISKFCMKRNSASHSEKNGYCETQHSSNEIDSQTVESIFDQKMNLNQSYEQESVTSVPEMSCVLTGLHTCGNLASSSLELFVHSQMVKVFCNVGCCYHLLTEEILDQRSTDMEHTSLYGFPLCSFLKRKQFSLGQTARNLASQSICRLEQSELQGKKFFPRALLEVLLSQIGFKPERQGKSLRGLEQKCSSVQEFIKRACHKLDVNIKVDDTIIEDLIHDYQDQEIKLAAFFQLRTVLAPCIESLIILDRVCYLLEQKLVKDVNIVKMFDPVISPRCFGIIATKS